MSTVFISYRRDDASANAGRLCDWLKRQFSADNVFLDTEKIAPGEAFPRVLEERLAASDVLLAVIGPRWASISDAAGNRRIANPKDFVALEVATALRRGSRVIPVLVGGAPMPTADQLPPALQGLEKLHAAAIDDSRFPQDFDNLVDAIVGRARGFARRELDRLQRGVRVLKASSLIAPLIAILLLFAAWMQAFDAFLLDTRVASYSMWLGERFVGAPPESSVMLIAIDEDSEKRLGRKYGRAPEWRMDHARMIDRLAAAGVAAVAFDLYIEDENESERAADAAIADAIRRANQKGIRVIIGIRAAPGQVPRLLPALIDAGATPGSLCIGSRLGYAFNAPLAVSPDARGSRALRADNPALGLVAAFPGRAETIDEERREVSVRAGGDTHFAAFSVLDSAGSPSAQCPTLGAGSVIATLLLRLSPGGFWREPQRRMSYAQVLDPASTLRPEVLRGKIALIGVTLSEAGDSHRVMRGWKREQIFGVELHADTITNLERRVAVRPLGPTAQWLFMLALAAAGAAMSFLLFDRAARYRGLALGLALVAYACAGVVLYVAFGILLNVLYDVAAFAAAYTLLRHLQKKALAEPIEEVSP
ncbi:MAG TPA: CHASE2 domain-containing protein [Casimicrobiaceae bacterium]|nr:CHASE2 domain-containing protein [Casimicrobiaceae bacterium]